MMSSLGPLMILFGTLLMTMHVGGSWMPPRPTWPGGVVLRRAFKASPETPADMRATLDERLDVEIER